MTVWLPEWESEWVAVWVVWVWVSEWVVSMPKRDDASRLLTTPGESLFSQAR